VAHDAVIDIRGLVKTFGPHRALDGLDLEVGKGEVHGFLGPNGAGKSTTIRALLGLLRVDAGTATVFGRDPWRDAVAIHRRLAYESGTLAELRHLRRSRITATVGRVPEGLDGLAGVHDLTVDGTSLTLTVDPDGLPLVLRSLTDAGVTALTSAPPTLEELFLDAYRTQPLWGLLGVFFVPGQLGGLLELPGWVTGLSPFDHTPAMPVEPFHAQPALVLTALAAVCLVAAWWRYRSRDIG
jgi:energy-coupling factor transporter ATP-binding protein EcfA2